MHLMPFSVAFVEQNEKGINTGETYNDADIQVDKIAW